MNSQKRIDSFFKKSDSDTPKKKQCQEKDVKENEVPEARKSKPITKNPPSTDSADSSSNIPADLYLTARQIQANQHATRKHSRGPFVRERFAYDARRKRNDLFNVSF